MSEETNQEHRQSERGKLKNGDIPSLVISLMVGLTALVLFVWWVFGASTSKSYNTSRFHGLIVPKTPQSRLQEAIEFIKSAGVVLPDFRSSLDEVVSSVGDSCQAFEDYTLLNPQEGFQTLLDSATGKGLTYKTIYSEEGFGSEFEFFILKGRSPSVYGLFTIFKLSDIKPSLDDVGFLVLCSAN